MNGREFLRRARRYARDRGLEFYFDSRRGKGSHGEVHVGEYRTIVQRGEIAAGTLSAMLRDLNIPRQEF